MMSDWPEGHLFIHYGSAVRVRRKPRRRLVFRPGAIRERLLRLEEVIPRLEELRRLDARALREGFREAWAVAAPSPTSRAIVARQDGDGHMKSAGGRIQFR